MPTVLINYGSMTEFSQENNLNSLANSAAKPLGEVDNSVVLAEDYMVFFRVTLNSSGVSSTGSIELYLIEKADATDDMWTDNIDADGTSDIASSIKNAKQIEIFAANANSQVVTVIFRLGDYIACAPKYWSIIAYNKTGAAFDADDADNKAAYIPLKRTF